MSDRTPLCTRIKFLAALLLGASLVAAGMSQALAQDNSVPVTALSELVSRVRESSPAGIASLNAITVARRLLVEQRYSEADELYRRSLKNYRANQPCFMAPRSLNSTWTGRPKASLLLAQQPK